MIASPFAPYTLPRPKGTSPGTCSICGERDLSEFFTSYALGLQLCRPCFQYRVEQGLAQEE